jgi:cell wall assembly regulator SMI1
MTVAELASRIRSIEGVMPNRGATQDQIAAVEVRLGVALPSELKQLVAVMNGCDGETPVDQGWIHLWPLQLWERVAESGSTDRYADAIMFADHCQHSWMYAFEAAGGDKVRILKINGPDGVVCESLAEFLEAVLIDDPNLYGPPA